MPAGETSQGRRRSAPWTAASGNGIGHTLAMRTAITVPDRIFKKADRLARRLRKSRSQLYSEAVADYLLRHDPDAITEQMNQVCEKIDTRSDSFVASAARRILDRTEW
jgi:predicted transcriptional regulator